MPSSSAEASSAPASRTISRCAACAGSSCSSAVRGPARAAPGVRPAAFARSSRTRSTYGCRCSRATRSSGSPDDTGVDPGFERRGYLWIAETGDELRVLHDALAVQRANGVGDATAVSAQRDRVDQSRNSSCARRGRNVLPERRFHSPAPHPGGLSSGRGTARRVVPVRRRSDGVRARARRQYHGGPPRARYARDSRGRERGGPVGGCGRGVRGRRSSGHAAAPAGRGHRSDARTPRCDADDDLRRRRLPRARSRRTRAAAHAGRRRRDPRDAGRSGMDRARVRRRPHTDPGARERRHRSGRMLVRLVRGLARRPRDRRHGAGRAEPLSGERIVRARRDARAGTRASPCGAHRRRSRDQSRHRGPAARALHRQRAQPRACSNRSTIVTFASPPPSHIVCRPKRPPRRSSACSNVAISFVPDAPSG